MCDNAPCLIVWDYGIVSRRNIRLIGVPQIFCFDVLKLERTVFTV